MATVCEDKTCTLRKGTGKYEWDSVSYVLTTPDGRDLDAPMNTFGLNMVIDPEGKINRGLPTPVADLLYENTYNERIATNRHMYSGGDLFNTMDERGTNTIAAIHKYYRNNPNRGRPLTIQPEDAKRAKVAYYVTGNKTVRELAQEFGTAEATMRRILKGDLMWYA